ncbi:MAG: hypothetical protein V2A79_04865 [Planctomycetota bacterium]
MKPGRIRKIAATVVSGAMLFATGACLPDNYWADFLGESFSAAAGQVVEDFISDTVDVVDPGSA